MNSSHPISSTAHQLPSAVDDRDLRRRLRQAAASMEQHSQPCLLRGRRAGVDQRQGGRGAAARPRAPWCRIGQQQHVVDLEGASHASVRRAAPIAASRGRCRPRSKAVRATVVTGMPATLVTSSSARAAHCGRSSPRGGRRSSTRSVSMRFVVIDPVRAVQAPKPRTPAMTPRSVRPQPRPDRPVAQRRRRIAVGM